MPHQDLQADEFNYDESKVPQFELPNPLVDAEGKRIQTAAEWTNQQRAKIFELVETQVYGSSLGTDVTMSVQSASQHESDGIVRKQVTLRISRQGKSLDMHLLMHLPAKAKQAVPVFLGLNFNGNHTTTDDPDVPVTQNWVRNDEKKGYENHRASEQSRGAAKSRWPYQHVVSRGYGVATIYYGDIDPDFDDGFKSGIHALFADDARTASSGGSLSAWAWGLSRAVDYLEMDDDVDNQRVIVIGHSRLGKTSLWAGASDPRFAMVVSNDSGCGGAALSRRQFGETVKRINTSFPHWFCKNYRQYNDNETACPVDQHSLIALIAPRPVLICSAEDDRWADPRGEFLSGLAASSVFQLLGTDGMSAAEFPGVNKPIMSRIGYQMRPGGHDVKLQDWDMYMDFADKHLGN